MFAVVNHLHLNIPVDQISGQVAAEGMPLLAQNPGFRDFMLVKTAEDRCIVIILWDSAEHAQHGARVFGPTWFNDHIIPHLASEQQRSVGPVVASFRDGHAA